MADDVALEHEIDHIENILADDDPEALLDLWVLQSRHKHCDITADVTSSALREEELEALERHFLIDDVASCFATSFATDAETSLGDLSSENDKRAPHSPFDGDIDEVEALSIISTHGQKVDMSRSAVQKASKRDRRSLSARKKLSAGQTSLLQNCAEVTSGKSTTSEKLSLSKDILLDEEDEGLISFDLPFLPLSGRGYDVTERDRKFTTIDRQAAIPPPSVSVFQRAETTSKTNEPSRKSHSVTPLTQDGNTPHDVTPLVEHDVQQSDLHSASPKTRPFLSSVQDKIMRDRNPVTTSFTVSCGRGSDVTEELGRSKQQLRKIQEYLETVDVFLNSALNPRSSGQTVRSCVVDARKNVQKALQELDALQSCDITIDVSSRARLINDKGQTGVALYGHEAQREDSLDGIRVMKMANLVRSPPSINVVAGVIVAPKPPDADDVGEETTAAPLADLSPCHSSQKQVDESDSSDATTTSKTTVMAKPPFEAPAISQSVPLPLSETSPLNPTDTAEVTLARTSGEGSLPPLDQNALTDVTSFASVSDQRWTLEGSCVSAEVTTSADESSYYSDDDDDDDEELTENGLPWPGDRYGMFRRPVLEFGAGDPADEVLREERLVRHLAAVRQQAVPSAVRVETVVTATGERLGNHSLALDQSRDKEHVNVGHLYPFSSKSCHIPTPSSHQTSESDHVTKDEVKVVERSSRGNTSDSKNARHRGGRATFSATFARFFRPLQSVALFSARQMTSEEFQEGYDKAYDAIKVKRCELDNDIPWDQLQFSDTEDDTKSEKTWREQSSEDSFTHADLTDSDSYASASN